MRLRNFCVQMGFALFVAVILVVFVHNVPLAVLYVIGHLIWAFFSDRQTIYGESTKSPWQKNIRPIQCQIPNITSAIKPLYLEIRL